MDGTLSPRQLLVLLPRQVGRWITLKLIALGAPRRFVSYSISRFAPLFLGLRREIARIEYTQESKKRRPSSIVPLMIEIIGPSGVGKSTMMKALLQSAEIKEFFRPFGGLIQSRQAATRLPDPEWTLGGTAADSAYLELLVEKTRRLLDPNISFLRHQDICRLLNTIQFQTSVLERDFVIRRFFSKETIISDEGIFHNFGPEIDTCLREGILLSPLLARRIVINLQAKSAVIARQVLERQAVGGGWGAYLNPSPVAIQAQAESESNRIERFVSLMQKSGVPCLSVTATDPFGKNISMIKEFLSHAITSQYPSNIDGKI